LENPGGSASENLNDAVSWLSGCDVLPPDVDAKARLLLLDTLGCLLAGLRHADVIRFGTSLRLAFPGETAWPTSDIRLGAAGLGALGAAAACWDEACEGNSASHGRPGLPLVPALLALTATRPEINLGQLLVGLVTGYEIGARAGQAWRIPPGWHVDGSWHSLSVAAGVARLTSGTERIQSAVEAAAAQLPASLYLPISVGSVLRNTYPAHAVLLGILASAAAAAGFVMPRNTLEEARRRVLRLDTPASLAPAGQWTILDGYLKPFAAVRHTHYGVDACLRLRKRSGFALENIKTIKLEIYPEAAHYCGNRAPTTAIQAQFSLSYAIAAALVCGDLGPEAFDDINDPKITRLETCVIVEPDPSRVRRSAKVTINIGGRVFTESAKDIIGDPAIPMTRDDVAAKFLRYLGGSLGHQRSHAIIECLLDGDANEPACRVLALASEE
jgi:2-methylcitrate dehydratase PrpD